MSAGSVYQQSLLQSQLCSCSTTTGLGWGKEGLRSFWLAGFSRPGLQEVVLCCRWPSSISKTEVVGFGGGHHDCACKMAGQQLTHSQSSTYLSKLFRKMKHAIHAHFSKACASLECICSQYPDLQCANLMHFLVRLQQAILQPCASHGCKVWVAADAVIGKPGGLQSQQHSILGRACPVTGSVPTEV